MAEKRNLVIKVKYAKGEKLASTAVPATKTITVWQYDRIAWAAGAVLVVALAIAGLVGTLQSPPAPATAIENSSPIIPAQPPLVAAQKPAAPVPHIQVRPTPATPTQPAVTPAPTTVAASATLQPSAIRVRRALLTNHVIDKEPQGELSSPLYLTADKPAVLYFFTEVRGMTGKTLYHEWRHQGVTVSKEPLWVGADRWRASSHRTLDNQAVGEWTLRMTDEAGRLLTEKNLVVVVEPKPTTTDQPAAKP